MEPISYIWLQFANFAVDSNIEDGIRVNSSYQIINLNPIE